MKRRAAVVPHRSAHTPAVICASRHAAAVAVRHDSDGRGRVRPSAVHLRQSSCVSRETRSRRTVMRHRSTTPLRAGPPGRNPTEHAASSRPAAPRSMSRTRVSTSWRRISGRRGTHGLSSGRDRHPQLATPFHVKHPVSGRSTRAPATDAPASYAASPAHCRDARRSSPRDASINSARAGGTSADVDDRRSPREARPRGRTLPSRPTQDGDVSRETAAACRQDDYLRVHMSPPRTRPRMTVAMRGNPPGESEAHARTPTDPASPRA